MTKPRKNWQRVTLLVLCILLGVAFILSGAMKFTNPEQLTEGVERWGYPMWFLQLAGIIEVVAGIMILVPKTRFPGAAILVITMAGAAVTHLKAGEYSDLPPPLILPGLSAAAAWLACPSQAESPSEPVDSGG